MKSDPCARDRSGARAAIRLDDVAVDDDLAFADRGQVADRAERAADEALDLLRAAGGLAGIDLAARALVGGARQHGVFRRDPTLAGAAQPWRSPLFEGRRAHDPRIAERHEARALRVARDAAFQGHRAQLVGGALRGPHGENSPVDGERLKGRRRRRQAVAQIGRLAEPPDAPHIMEVPSPVRVKASDGRAEPHSFARRIPDRRGVERPLPRDLPADRRSPISRPASPSARAICRASCR